MKRPALRFLTTSLGLIASLAGTAPAAITLTNLHDGETIEYSAPLLLGTLDRSGDGTLTVNNLSSHRPDTRVITGLTHAGRFKAMTELVPGENKLQLTAGEEKSTITLNFKPQSNPHFIRAVYFVDDTGNTRYDTPIQGDPQDYAAKYDATMKLMQTFTAEWMNAYGYGRRTFNLELNPSGKVVVHVVKGKHPAEYYEYGLHDRNNLYDTVTDEVVKALPEAPSVDCTLIGFSKLDVKTGHSVAYTALGGGKVALFGGACMYSFPDSVADIQKAFLNGTYIDGKRYVSDSVDRFTMWATASTSIGAMMHETGHSMGLPHTLDKRDMMTRGMDYISRNFVFSEPPSMRNKQTVIFADRDIGYWSPESAAALAPSVWFQMNATRISSTTSQTAIDLSSDGSEIVVKNPSGVGFVGYEIPGAAKAFVQIDQAAMPKEVRVPLTTVLAAVSRERGQIRVIDGNGNMINTSISEFGEGFVRAWQFAPTALPWAQNEGAPNLDDTAVEKLTAALTAQAMTTAKAPRIDFEAVYPKVEAPRVAYLMRTIKSDEAQQIKLLTGSDDGLRMWLNGSLIASVLQPRAARPDSDTTEASLQKGVNRLLVEVTDTGGAWAFYLRMTDLVGKPLQLNDDGTLKSINAPTELMK